MLKIYIFYSKYLFLWLLVTFLFLGFSGIYEKKRGYFDLIKRKIYQQRGIVTGIHINAFIILFLVRSSDSIDWETIWIGIGMLIFLILGWILLDYKCKNEDGFLWNAIFLLLVLSIVLLHRLSPSLAKKQLVWIYLSFTFATLFSFFFKFFSTLKKGEIIYMIIGWGLLVLPFFFGEERYGAINWVNIRNFNFQPSEFVKVIMVLYLASVLKEEKSIKEWIVPLITVCGYIGILVIQRDLGGAFIYFITALSLIYIAIGKEILFLGGLGIASVAGLIAYPLFPHVQIRVEAWLNPWKNIDGRGYQVAQSLFALGSWGWIGSGLTKGYAGYVPAVTTDFIFAAICEEFGSLFGIGIIIVFLFIFIQMSQRIIKVKNTFNFLLGVGLISIFSFQTFLILGGVLKVIPLTGVTLPFLSYGGSSMFISMLMFKLMQWIGGEQESLAKERE